MYIFSVAVGLGAVYLFLFYLFPYFFQNSVPVMSRKVFRSAVLMAVLSILIFTLSFEVEDLDFSNRVLHVGGGFLAFLACFLAARDSGVKINRFQFFVFSFLAVISLGAANEMLEYILQNYFGFSFAKTSNDTWLDLISNSAGALAAGAVLTPFIKKDKGL